MKTFKDFFKFNFFTKKKKDKIIYMKNAEPRCYVCNDKVKSVMDIKCKNCKNKIDEKY